MFPPSGQDRSYNLRGQPLCVGRDNNLSGYDVRCTTYVGNGPRIYKSTDELSTYTTYYYDSGLRVYYVRNPAGDYVNYGYSGGLLTSTTLRGKALSAYDTRTLTRDGLGLVTLSADTRSSVYGKKHGYEYDGYNRRIATRQYTSSWSTPTHRTDSYFDANGRLVWVADYNHAENGDDKHDDNEENINIMYDYDALGRNIHYARLGPSGWIVVTEKQYDRQGNLAGVAEGDGGAVTTYLHDDLGRLVVKTKNDDDEIGEDWYVYDAMSNRKTTERLCKSCPSGDIELASAFDMLRRPLTVSEIGEYHYDDKTGLTTTLNCTGHTIVIQDNHDRGRLAYVTDDEGRTFYMYDAKGRLVTEARQTGGGSASCDNTVATDYVYDENSNVKKIVYPSGREVEYNRKYDFPSDLDYIRLKFSSSWYTVLTPSEHYPFDRTKSWDWGNDMDHLETMDHAGRTTEVRDNYSSTDHLRLGYNAYDGMGNCTEVDDMAYGGGDRSYSYDPGHYFMTQWTRPNITQNATYDCRGNRLTWNLPQTNDYRTYYYEVDEDTNRNTSVLSNHEANSVWYDYDELGRTTHVEYPTVYDVNYAWDGWDRMITMSNWWGTHTNHYDYRRRNIEFEPITGYDPYFYYSYGPRGWDVLEERYEDCNVDCDKVPQGAGTYNRSEYVWYDGAPRIAIHSTTPNKSTAYSDVSLGYVFSDKQKLPRRVLDHGRSQIWYATFDEFGGMLSSTGTMNISLRYPGQVYNPSMQIMANWYRWYDYKRGRYLTQDPMGEIGAYPYVSANPVTFADPMGLYLMTAFETAVDAGMSCYDAEHATPGCSFNDAFTSSYMSGRRRNFGGSGSGGGGDSASGSGGDLGIEWPRCKNGGRLVLDFTFTASGPCSANIASDCRAHGAPSSISGKGTEVCGLSRVNEDHVCIYHPETDDHFVDCAYCCKRAECIGDGCDAGQ